MVDNNNFAVMALVAIVAVVGVVSMVVLMNGGSTKEVMVSSNGYDDFEMPVHDDFIEPVYDEEGNAVGQAFSPKGYCTNWCSNQPINAVPTWGAWLNCYDSCLKTIQ